MCIRDRVISDRSIPETTSNKFVQGYLKLTCRYLAPVLIILVLLVKLDVIDLKKQGEVKPAPAQSTLDESGQDAE